MANVVSMKQLLEAGVHFGHQTRRWNPKMAEYIFTERNGIYHYDLAEDREEAGRRLTSFSSRMWLPRAVKIIFVGTKKRPGVH